MTYATDSLSSTFYRPRKLPRVIRRQLPVLRLCMGIVGIGVLAVTITWRNLTHDRLVLDVGLQRSQIEMLEKETQHLAGQIETESAYPRIAKWARDHHGWRALPGHSATVVLQEQDLTPGARDEAKLLGIEKP